MSDIRTEMLRSKINESKFDEAAQLLRDQLIDVVSHNGGHLAPSLGVVELTIALHKVFNSPKDAIVWDVGHQAYSHKILTGRGDQFHTLRKMSGISGFPKRSESEHDAFGAGHSSTSISAALGIAEAKRISGEAGKVIAVIGDGSMTAGLAFEGLNHAGHLKNKRLIIIFNDNQMSIDKNVGALSSFMNKGLTSPTYNRIRRDLGALLKIVSTKNLDLVELTKRAALAVKDFFLASHLFGAFGFRYIGPIDGHDIPLLISTLERISANIDNDDDFASPVLLHVLTQKGRGYQPAEDNPTRFHGVGPFNVEDGTLIKSDVQKPTYTSIFGDAVCDLMKRDSRIVAITAAMPTGTGLDKAKTRFPGRYYDVGIAELHAVVMAAGMATRGFRPIVAIYSSFMQRAYDAIIHDVALQKLPVILALDRAGVVGDDGPTHHGLFDLSYLRHIPNLAVMSPKDGDELRSMIFSAADYGIPVALRYPRGTATIAAVDGEPKKIPLGEAEIVINRDDANLSIIAIGNMVKVAIEAAIELEKLGIRASVINGRFIKPLDEDIILREAMLGRGIVTIEDNMLAGGFGSGVLELLNTKGHDDVQLLRLGYPDEFVEQGTIPELHEKYGLTPALVADRIMEDFSHLLGKDESEEKVPQLQ